MYSTRRVLLLEQITSPVCTCATNQLPRRGHPPFRHDVLHSVVLHPPTSNNLACTLTPQLNTTDTTPLAPPNPNPIAMGYATAGLTLAWNRPRAGVLPFPSLAFPTAIAHFPFGSSGMIHPSLHSRWSCCRGACRHGTFFYTTLPA